MVVWCRRKQRELKEAECGCHSPTPAGPQMLLFARDHFNARAGDKNAEEKGSVPEGSERSTARQHHHHPYPEISHYSFAIGCPARPPQFGCSRPAPLGFPGDLGRFLVLIVWV